MNAKGIISKKIYLKYLKEIESLIDLEPKKNSPEFERIYLLSLAIEKYEYEKHPLKKLTLKEFLQTHMEENNLKQTDLIPIIGSKSKVSEVLSGKRPLSLSMIKRISKYLKIPSDLLIESNNAYKNLS